MREFAINTGRAISGQAVASDACSPNPRTFLRSDGAHLPTRSTTARADVTAANGSSFREQFERGQPTWSVFTAERIHRPLVSFASQDAAHVAMTAATLHDVRERLHRVACVRRGIRRFVRRERANKRTNDRPTSNHFLRPLRGSSFLPSLLPRGWPKINEGDCQRLRTIDHALLPVPLRRPLVARRANNYPPRESSRAECRAEGRSECPCDRARVRKDDGPVRRRNRRAAGDDTR